MHGPNPAAIQAPRPPAEGPSSDGAQKVHGGDGWHPTLLTARLAVGAQQAERVYRIGLFHVSLDHVPPALYGLRQGLKELDMRKARICAGTSATCPMKRPRKRRHGNSFGSGWM